MVSFSKNWLRLGAIVSCLVLMSGCAYVYIPKPIGERQTDISPNDWEGVWISGGFAMNIKVLDKEKGELRVAFLDEGQSGEFELQSYRVHLTRWENWQFISFNEKEDSEHYIWGRLEKREGQIIIWWPNDVKFGSAIEEGILPGVTKERYVEVSLKGPVIVVDVFLGDLNAEHMELITTSEKEVLFDWENPMIFLRIGK